MGAWGPGTFENDQALDWLANLATAAPSLVRAALEAVADAPADVYATTGDCCVALVAAEIVAAACGCGDDRLDDDARTWLEQHRAAFAASDRDLARRAVERILTVSELLELWDEGGRDDEWHADVDELMRRLAK